MPGGLAYGYEVVPPKSESKEAGERRIRPDEAAIVQRIFHAFAAGDSPRRIAAKLNGEGVPGPRGRPWGDTMIRGQIARGTGVLNNPLYIGRLEWNRCSYIKDPTTGKRVARVNAKDQNEVAAVPELRIIDDAMWEAVKARQIAVRTAAGFKDGETGAKLVLNSTHRSRFFA